MPSQNDTFHHISVLSQAVTAGLQLKSQGKYLDATLGGGGHSELILRAAESIHLTAIDRDLTAITASKTRLKDYINRVTYWHGNFAQYPGKKASFDGILADLGVSSPQLDTAERGFSFQQEAPLDMRMDRSQTMTAAKIINHWSEKDLADIFYQYGEERFSRRIARYIVQRRPLYTTIELAQAIAQAVHPKYRYGRIHPATRCFQALRIVVNQELSSLENFLNLAPSWLKPGGRIAIISFHSLEDRIVKHSFKNSDVLKIITKKPLIAQAEEQKINPRSRSAKLRIAEKIDE